jgi:hypothetical protein
MPKSSRILGGKREDKCSLFTIAIWVVEVSQWNRFKRLVYNPSIGRNRLSWMFNSLENL